MRGLGDRLPSLRVVDASARRGLNHARNVGAAAAAGADLIGGSFDVETLNAPETRAWISGDSLTALPAACRSHVYVPGGNSAVWASVAQALRWDEDFRFGSSDIEFSWRAHFAGYALAFAPDAVMRRRYPARAGDVARQHFSYGVSLPLRYQHFRGARMPRSDLGEALWAWRCLLRRTLRALRSSQFRGQWFRVAGLRSGRTVGSIRRRVLYL